MSVLIASLVADNEPWLSRFLQQLNQLDYDKQLLHYAFLEGPTIPLLHEWSSSKHNSWIRQVNPQIVDRFARLAYLRNYLVDNALSDEDYILWIDSDIVKIPSTLITNLRAHAKAVIAPSVWIEEAKPRDQFYDTLAFRDLEGKNFPVFSLPYSGLVQVSSVGSCYLVNSKLYRNSKVRYSGGDSEHVTFCSEVRKLGEKVYADFDVKIWHVNLQGYGRHWH